MEIKGSMEGGMMTMMAEYTEMRASMTENIHGRR